ncbi:MAG: hypothetical protein E7574_00745 [Ruminococcaceae bacterium]|nr:hypothetical protein [Oscillospiraceae bacterium]
MQKTQNKTHLLFVYTVFSCIFFIIGLTLCYVLPIDSYVYKGLEDTLINSIVGTNGLSLFRLSDIIPSFLCEAKYVIFILFASFTKYREILFPFFVSFKGFVVGISVACLMRSIKYGNLDASYGFLCCSVFVILSVCLILVICWLCATSSIYSNRLIYPLRLNLIIKRKDTYNFLLDFLAVCGALLIIVFLKIGNFSLMIS